MVLERIRVAVCDDQPTDLQRINQAILEIMKELGLEESIDIRLFADGKSLYESNSKNPFDLLFLDIEMPEWNGMELAKRLGADNSKLKLIFVSSHENWVFDTYEYMPLWFVRKNSLERDLKKALMKYLQLTSRRTISYKIKQGFSNKDILIKDILYIECNDHQLTLRTMKGEEYQMYGSLQSAENDLKKYDFVRVHRSYLVNQAYITDVEKTDVRLIGDLAVPVAKDRRRSVKEAMVVYGAAHD